MSVTKINNYYLPEHHEILLEKVLNVVNAYICIIDIQQLKILWSNNYIIDKLGLSLNEITNMTYDEIFELIHPDHRSFIKKEIKSIRRKNQNSQCSLFKIKSKNCYWNWVLGNYSIYERDTNGQVLKILLLAKEININQGHSKLEELRNNCGEDIDNPTLVNKLSAREMEIVEHIFNGKSDREIAESLFISIHTAKTHRKKIIRKLGLRNSRTLIKYVYEKGLVKLNPDYV